MKRKGGKTVLLSGKMSEKSEKRFRLLFPLSKLLFSRFDLIGVQNEEHLERFKPFINDRSRLFISGNLKLDFRKEEVSLPPFLSPFLSKKALAITCTHEKEEELLLKTLLPLNISLFLAPRHPERFASVEKYLLEKNISYQTYTSLERGAPFQNPQVLLIDALGKLSYFYTLSKLTIVGGSFSDKIGGHNILEPCMYKTPVFFGPHMWGQKEFQRIALKEGIGKQVSYPLLKEEVEKFFQEEPLYLSRLELFLAKREKLAEKNVSFL